MRPDEFTQAAALLSSPLGQSGSGRVRYAAAMALYQTGQISAEALEVYRICSSRDGEDPAGLLAARGLAMPDLAEGSPVSALVAEIDRYLATLAGDGIAEVRAGIAVWRDRVPLKAEGRGHPVLTRHLGAALAALGATHAALAAAIAAAAPCLDWQHFSDYPPDEIGAAFLAGNAYCTVIGQSGPIAAEGFDLGLFLIAPHLLYRDHRHRAPELYAPLTGPHGWRFGPGMPLAVRPAHVPVWNEPDVPHLTKVGPVPFLCIYAWTRDVDAAPQVVPADDWAELEALRLA